MDYDISDIGGLSGKPYKRLLALLKPDRSAIRNLYGFAVLSGFVGLILPLGVQAIFTLIQSAQLSASWFLLVILVVVGVIIGGVLNIIQLSITETLQQRIFARSAFDFSRRLPHLKAEDLGNEYPPEMVNRFFDVHTIQKNLSKLLIDITTAVLQIVFGLILLSFYHSFFVFFGVLVLTILFLIFRITGPTGLKSSLNESKYKYKLVFWLQEVGRTMGIFKLAGRIPTSVSNTNAFTLQYLKYRTEHFQILRKQYIYLTAFKTFVIGGLVILGSLLVMNEQLNLGQFVASEIVIILLIQSVEKLIFTMEPVYDTLTAVEKLGHVIDSKVERTNGKEWESSTSGIDLKMLNVSFKFDHDNAIENFSLHVPAGQKVCLAGFNGSGKSTLLKLAAGMYTDFTGTIRFNDENLVSLELDSLRSDIGELFNGYQLFHGTIMENLVLGRAEVDEGEIRKITQELGIYDQIQNLPHGFNTQVMPDGMGIPRSLVAKLCIARAMAGNPSMLLLDESFLGITRSERKSIIDVLTHPSKTWTLLRSSNDAYFAEKCDRIIVLKNGKIFADSTYEEVKAQPWFEELFVF